MGRLKSPDHHTEEAAFLKLPTTMESSESGYPRAGSSPDLGIHGESPALSSSAAGSHLHESPVLSSSAETRNLLESERENNLAGEEGPHPHTVLEISRSGIETPQSHNKGIVRLEDVPEKLNDPMGAPIFNPFT
jgi:hypothetical protein